MAVNIDTVYQKVLSLANKEQRGYITPQEFNLYADHAQKEIFEQYFYDLNQFSRMHGNSTSHSDMLDTLEIKISAFESWTDISNIAVDINGNANLQATFPDLHKIIEVFVDYGDGYKKAEEVTAKEFTKYSQSPLTIYSEKRPVYVHYFDNNDTIKIYPLPEISSDIKVNYVRTPNRPNWGYVVLNDKALYNANSSNNFQLHRSEEQELVYKILKLAGINLDKGQVVQGAQALETQQVQQEKA